MNEAQRGRGRPRKSGADDAILAATIAGLAQAGYAELSLESIAARAAVTRPTLYRRYPNKQALVIAALSAAFESVNPRVPDYGDARRDVRALLENIAAMLTKTPIGDVIRGLLPELPRDAALAELAARFAEARRALLRDAIARGVDRGELPASLDVEVAIDALLGGLYFRFLFLSGALSRAYVTKLVAQILG